jgi:hypothetical protein
MKLKRALMMSAIFLLTANVAYASDNLDADTIKKIHVQVKIKFLEKCKEEMEGATDAICNCLADKAAASLDDSILASCSNDKTGGPCIVNAVSIATKKALSKESVKLCNPTVSSED